MKGMGRVNVLVIKTKKANNLARKERCRKKSNEHGRKKSTHHATAGTANFPAPISAIGAETN